MGGWSPVRSPIQTSNVWTDSLGGHWDWIFLGLETGNFGRVPELQDLKGTQGQGREGDDDSVVGDYIQH